MTLLSGVGQWNNFTPQTSGKFSLHNASVNSLQVTCTENINMLFRTEPVEVILCTHI